MSIDISFQRTLELDDAKQLLTRFMSDVDVLTASFSNKALYVMIEYQCDRPGLAGLLRLLPNTPIDGLWRRCPLRALPGLIRVMPKVSVCDPLVLHHQETRAFWCTALKMYRVMNGIIRKFGRLSLYEYPKPFLSMACLFLAKASEFGEHALLLHGVVAEDRLLHGDRITGACYEMTIQCSRTGNERDVGHLYPHSDRLVYVNPFHVQKTWTQPAFHPYELPVKRTSRFPGLACCQCVNFDLPPFYTGGRLEIPFDSSAWFQRGDLMFLVAVAEGSDDLRDESAWADDWRPKRPWDFSGDATEDISDSVMTYRGANFEDL